MRIVYCSSLGYRPPCCWPVGSGLCGEGGWIWRGAVARRQWSCRGPVALGDRLRWGRGKKCVGLGGPISPRKNCVKNGPPRKYCRRDPKVLARPVLRNWRSSRTQTKGGPALPDGDKGHEIPGTHGCDRGAGRCGCYVRVEQVARGAGVRRQLQLVQHRPPIIGPSQ